MWLRLDDRFTEHRKILALGKRSDRWTWLELLEYCARHSSPHVPANIDERLRYVTPAFVARCVELRLLDTRPDGSYEVHDWAVYNAQTTEDRVRAYLESNPEATANEVHRAVGGKRDMVLRLVQAIRDTKPNTGSEGTDTPGSLGGSPNGSREVPLARARGPHPTRTPRESSSPPDPRDAGPADDDAETALTLDRLAAAGWNDRQLRDVDLADLPRAIAWLDHAERTNARSPGALAWSGYASNAWPPEARLEVAPGATGTRSTRTIGAHVCPECGLDYPTESRLIDHRELVHDHAREPELDRGDT